jgi:hypothetical protein
MARRFGIGDLTLPPRRRGRQPPFYPVWRFLGAYLLCLLALPALLIGAATLHAGLLLLLPLAYLGCGVALSRYVSRGIVFSPFSGTLGRVARAKWEMFLFWPRAMPRLIWDLLWVRYL